MGMLLPREFNRPGGMLCPKFSVYPYLNSDHQNRPFSRCCKEEEEVFHAPPLWTMKIESATCDLSPYGFEGLVVVISIPQGRTLGRLAIVLFLPVGAHILSIPQNLHKLCCITNRCLNASSIHRDILLANSLSFFNTGTSMCYAHSP